MIKHCRPDIFTVSNFGLAAYRLISYCQIHVRPSVAMIASDCTSRATPTSHLHDLVGLITPMQSPKPTPSLASLQRRTVSPSSKYVREVPSCNTRGVLPFHVDSKRHPLASSLSPETVPLARMSPVSKLQPPSV
jgi:hypothetical protein